MTVREKIVNKTSIIFMCGLLAACAGPSNRGTVNAQQLAEIQHGKPVQGQIPIFSQTLTFMLPDGWVPVYEKRVGDWYISETVPMDQSAKNWSEMVTINGFKGAAGRTEPVQAIEAIAKRFEAACPESFVYTPIGATEVDGYRGFEAIIGCGEMPADEPTGARKGQSEIAYILAIKGSKDVYMVQKALRGQAFAKANLPLTLGNYKEFSAMLFPITLCDRGLLSRDCK